MVRERPVSTEQVIVLLVLCGVTAHEAHVLSELSDLLGRNLHRSPSFAHATRVSWGFLHIPSKRWIKRIQVSESCSDCSVPPGLPTLPLPQRCGAGQAPQRCLQIDRCWAFRKLIATVEIDMLPRNRRDLREQCSTSRVASDLFVG